MVNPYLLASKIPTTHYQEGDRAIQPKVGEGHVDLQVREPRSGWERRNQMFITSLEKSVAQDSWARIVDLFVDVMPNKDFGFAHVELNKEGN